MAAELPRTFEALAKCGDYARWAGPLAQGPAPQARTPRRRQLEGDGPPRDRADREGARLAKLDADEQHVYDLVARRFLGAFQPDAEFDDTTLVVRVGGVNPSAAAPALPEPSAAAGGPDEGARAGPSARRNDDRGARCPSRPTASTPAAACEGARGGKRSRA